MIKFYKGIKGFKIKSERLISMKAISSSIKKIIFCKLDENEDLLSAIKDLIDNYDISSASFYGIGAVKEAHIGFYKDKKYHENTLKQNLEVISFTGNIALNIENNEKIIHCHIVLGDSEGNSYGGHVLTGCKVSPTLEITLFELEDQIFRKYDEKTELTLLKM